jgi:ZIP family zinc transporter
MIDPELGLLLALCQVPADLPEGFAATAALRGAGIARARRLAMAAAFALPVIGGALLGNLALRDAPDLATVSVLALTGGMLTSVVVEEMVTEAHEGKTGPLDPVLLTAGVAVFALISAYAG